MNKNQHGFRSRHSTLTQLISFYDTIINELDKGSTVDAIYIDFAKAFDTVDHGILLNKLKQKAKIGGKIGIWIYNFLSKRTQQVSVNGELSEEVVVTSGVPQGTVLGPVLFLIMISDIDVNVAFSNVSMYADDTRIMKKISSDGHEMELKQDLNIIYNWCTENNMKFNSDKFELIVFDTKKRDQDGNKNYFAPSGNIIEEKQNLRDLGIQLSRNLKFSDHISNTVTKAKKMTYWILRTFKNREKETMMTLFKQMVLGIVEYCCPLWSPTDITSIENLEKIQQTFTRQISGMNSADRPDYWKRLKILKIYSLERRRERYMILYVFKALGNKIPNPGFIVKENERTGPTLQVPIKKKQSAISDSVFDRNLLSRGSKLFNVLPKKIRDYIGSDDLTAIKTILDNFLEQVPDQPSCAKLPKEADTNSILDQINYV